jgi:hypothetical protein
MFLGNKFRRMFGKRWDPEKTLPYIELRRVRHNAWKSGEAVRPVRQRKEKQKKGKLRLCGTYTFHLCAERHLAGGFWWNLAGWWGNLNAMWNCALRHGEILNLDSSTGEPESLFSPLLSIAPSIPIPLSCPPYLSLGLTSYPFTNSTFQFPFLCASCTISFPQFLRCYLHFPIIL